MKRLDCNGFHIQIQQFLNGIPKERTKPFFSTPFPAHFHSGDVLAAPFTQAPGKFILGSRGINCFRSGKSRPSSPASSEREENEPKQKHSMEQFEKY